MEFASDKERKPRDKTLLRVSVFVSIVVCLRAVSVCCVYPSMCKYVELCTPMYQYVLVCVMDHLTVTVAVIAVALVCLRQSGLW